MVLFIAYVLACKIERITFCFTPNTCTDDKQGNGGVKIFKCSAKAFCSDLFILNSQ